MARANQYRVEIDGSPVGNILSVKFGVNTARDSNGAPVDKDAQVDNICIERRSDENTDLFLWSLKPHQEYFKSGKIEFLDPRHEDKVICTIEFENAFLASYREIVPHVTELRNEPQTEYVEISSNKVTFNGIEWQGTGAWSLG